MLVEDEENPDLEKIVQQESLEQTDKESDSGTAFTPKEYYSDKVVYEQTTQSNNDPTGDLYISKILTKEYNNITGKVEWNNKKNAQLPNPDFEKPKISPF